MTSKQIAPIIFVIWNAGLFHKSSPLIFKIKKMQKQNLQKILTVVIQIFIHVSKASKNINSVYEKVAQSFQSKLESDWVDTLGWFSAIFY